MIVVQFGLSFVLSGRSCAEISHESDGFKDRLAYIVLFHCNYRIFMIEVSLGLGQRTVLIKWIIG